MGKPILFNTEMVQAILEGRKTTTRRIIKKKYDNTHLEVFKNKYGTRLVELQNNVEGETWGKNDDGSTWQKILAMIETEWEHKPYDVGDTLYVRETWQEWTGGYAYKVGGDYPQSFIDKWRPSIHMPKEAARIFLKVINVRAERLQDITEDQIKREGIREEFPPLAQDAFKELWDSTTKEYKWRLNPWVWVIEFERIEK